MFLLICILPVALLLVLLGYLAMGLGSRPILPLSCRTLTDGERAARLSEIARRVKAERLASSTAFVSRSPADAERASQLSEIARRVKAERRAAARPPACQAMSDEERATRLSEIALRVKAERALGQTLTR